MPCEFIRCSGCHPGFPLHPARCCSAPHPAGVRLLIAHAHGGPGRETPRLRSKAACCLAGFCSSCLLLPSRILRSCCSAARSFFCSWVGISLLAHERVFVLLGTAVAGSRRQLKPVAGHCRGRWSLPSFVAALPSQSAQSTVSRCLAATAVALPSQSARTDERRRADCSQLKHHRGCAAIALPSQRLPSHCRYSQRSRLSQSARTDKRSAADCLALSRQPDVYDKEAWGTGAEEWERSPTAPVFLSPQQSLAGGCQDEPGQMSEGQGLVRSAAPPL